MQSERDASINITPASDFRLTGNSFRPVCGSSGLRATLTPHPSTHSGPRTRKGIVQKEGNSVERESVSGSAQPDNPKHPYGFRLEVASPNIYRPSQGGSRTAVLPQVMEIKAN